LDRRPGAIAKTGSTSELLAWCVVALRGAGPAFGSFSRFVQLVESKYPMVVQESEELVAGEHQHLKPTCRSRTRTNFHLTRILLFWSFCFFFPIPSLDARDSVVKVKLFNSANANSKFYIYVLILLRIATQSVSYSVCVSLFCSFASSCGGVMLPEPLQL